MSYRTLVMAAAMLCAFGGCSIDPPHDNPLDPSSPKYTGTGSFHGRAALRGLSSTGVHGVRITTIPSTYDIATDSSGEYEFPAIPAGDYAIVASKNTYSSDTVRATIRTAEHLTIDFTMNAFPSVSNTKILMRKIDQWWPNPVYSAEISACVDDQDGIADIDSVWFCIDTLGFPMGYSVTSRNFELTLYPYQIPSNNIEWLVGKSFTIRARDLNGGCGTSAPFSISRMIEEEAVPTYPEFQDTTSASPTLQWTPPNVRFQYTYTLSIDRTDAGSDVAVWTCENVASHLTSYIYPAVLEPGNYFWTIAVVDEYGNYSRSKESTFVVR